MTLTPTAPVVWLALHEGWAAHGGDLWQVVPSPEEGLGSAGHAIPKSYLLPEEYRVTHLPEGGLVILDAQGVRCRLESRGGRPAVLTPEGLGPTLAPAPED